MSEPTACVDCAVRPAEARGLCNPCYQRHRYRGTLVDFERRTYARAELIEEWLLLAQRGYTRAQAAVRLGTTKAALDAAIAREQKAS